MKRFKRVARPAFEQAVDLLRDCSDWNPPLKSAAGGVAHLLRHIELRKENKASCLMLERRIIDVARDLANQPQVSPDLSPRVRIFIECLNGIEATLQEIQSAGTLAGHARVKREKVILDGCHASIESAANDLQLYVGLASERHAAERHAALTDQITTLGARMDFQFQNLYGDAIPDAPEVLLQVGPPGHRCALLYSRARVRTSRLTPPSFYLRKRSARVISVPHVKLSFLLSVPKLP
ncbi:hypothetical protein BKA62DRAFT_37367 [Auriculariales sp. MPI-PUGE-AT-0066]|nr:hypothetical protein BKA62DRAFT_37367 [Auriculariales sp. MPI-PUGE-AT-0066]